MDLKYTPMPPTKALFRQNQSCLEPDTPPDVLLLAEGKYLITSNTCRSLWQENNLQGFSDAHAAALPGFLG